jgi:hypothetical protein
LYALAFRLGGATDLGVAWGLIAAVIHWIIAGTFLGIVPGDGDEAVARPGPFAMRLGAPHAVSFFVSHLAFGALVGLTYFALHSAAGLDAAV